MTSRTRWRRSIATSMALLGVATILIGSGVAGQASGITGAALIFAFVAVAATVAGQRWPQVGNRELHHAPRRLRGWSRRQRAGRRSSDIALWLTGAGVGGVVHLDMRVPSRTLVITLLLTVAMIALALLAGVWASRRASIDPASSVIANLAGRTSLLSSAANEHDLRADVVVTVQSIQRTATVLVVIGMLAWR